ncbi:MAG TPA: flagellar filament capping protein FliD [Terriglobales bacterium]|jgi:flagellar hook-associated protein 2|nr:flagellar filament capping protein FliD [Terriglobales bacterium]
MGVSLNPSAILSGQGIDVNTVVQQILAAHSGQLSVWQGQQTTLATQNGLLAGMENNLINLKTAIAALADPTGALTAQAATSSQPGILTGTAQSSAIAGTHQIIVTSLATAGTLYTNPIAAGANASILPAGATGGDLQLQVGGAGGVTHDIPLTQGSNDTLNTLAHYINTQSGANNWGVTATVVSDTNGSRLALFSQSTGSAGALAITTNTSTGTLYTADLASADTSILPNGQSSGDIQLQIGGSSGTNVDLPITPGSNDTLNTLSNYINTQSATNNWGLTATVVQDSGGYHLAIDSSAQGPAGALAVTANTTILTTTPNPATNLTFDAPVGGANSVLSIDGVPFNSSSNTVTGAIQGVTLNLVSQSPSNPVTLTVGADTTQISNAVNNFVSAYNAVVSTINTQYVVDPTGSIPAPPLEGDSSLRSLQASMLTDAGFSIGGNSGLVNLASMGINMNNDGTLTIGSTPPQDSHSSGQTFAQILAANPSAVVNFFQNASATGFANNFNADLTNLTDSTQGPLNVDLAQKQAQQLDLSASITSFQSQLLIEQTQLTQQYDAVNASLQSYPLLLQAITETLGSMSTSSTGSTSSSSPTLTSGL